ncbi:MAG: hypothetical protein RIM72_20230 [Alphaproteobacteria bacterium]
MAAAITRARLIGLAADNDTDATGEARYALRWNYCSAITGPGGLPVVLPHDATRYGGVDPRRCSRDSAEATTGYPALRMHLCLGGPAGGADGLPVITSNQAMLWHGLRLAGRVTLPGFGCLMAL